MSYPPPDPTFPFWQSVASAGGSDPQFLAPVAPLLATDASSGHSDPWNLDAVTSLGVEDRAAFDDFLSELNSFGPDIWGPHTSPEAQQELVELYATPYEVIDGDWGELLASRAAADASVIHPTDAPVTNSTDAPVTNSTDAPVPHLPVADVATSVTTRSTPDSGFTPSATNTATSTALTTPDPYIDGNAGEAVGQPVTGPACVLPLDATEATDAAAAYDFIYAELDPAEQYAAFDVYADAAGAGYAQVAEANAAGERGVVWHDGDFAAFNNVYPVEEQTGEFDIGDMQAYEQDAPEPPQYPQFVEQTETPGMLVYNFGTWDTFRQWAEDNHWRWYGWEPAQEVDDNGEPVYIRSLCFACRTTMVDSRSSRVAHRKRPCHQRKVIARARELEKEAVANMQYYPPIPTPAVGTNRFPSLNVAPAATSSDNGTSPHADPGYASFAMPPPHNMQTQAVPVAEDQQTPPTGVPQLKEFTFSVPLRGNPAPVAVGHTQGIVPHALPAVEAPHPAVMPSPIAQHSPPSAIPPTPVDPATATASDKGKGRAADVGYRAQNAPPPPPTQALPPRSEDTVRAQTGMTKVRLNPEQRRFLEELRSSKHRRLV